MKADLSKAFVCKAEGPLKEFVGSKIDSSKKEKGLVTAKFTQPVLVQKLEDEYQVDVSEKLDNSGIDRQLEYHNNGRTN